ASAKLPKEIILTRLIDQAADDAVKPTNAEGSYNG
ncbi:MAG: hypothetical protein ACI9OI_002378, partial [Chitinophagales bacterium]